MLRAVPSRPVGWSSFESCQQAPRTSKQLRTVSGRFQEASSSSEQGSQLKQLGKVRAASIIFKQFQTPSSTSRLPRAAASKQLQASIDI
eukprot:6306036-Alexandrium_andersonii.AAC.1